MDKSLNAKFSKAHAFCDAVVAVDDPQTCLALLKLCAGTCHILHLLKVVPPSSTLKYAAGLDDKMVDTFQLCMGLNLTPLSLAQVFLPSRDGGAGIRKSYDLAAPSFLTTFSKYRTRGVTLLKLPTDFWQSSVDVFVSALDAYEPVAPPSAAQALHFLRDNRLSDVSHPDFFSLKWWNEQLSKRAWDTQFDQAPARDRARLRCIRDHHSVEVVAGSPVIGTWGS